MTDAAIPATPETPDVLPPPGPVYIGSPSQSNVDIFDPTSPVHLLGTESKRLTEGVGADYLLPLRGQGAPDVAVLQWPVPDGSSVSTAQPEARVFHFAGTYINMPAEPRDLVELSFLIQPADGNHEEQEFLLNGRILGSYLDVQSNETLVAQVDESHREGFTQRLVDVDVDGYMDLIVHIPHFSQVKLVVKNSDEAASASFWDVQLSGGPLTGWVSGSYGAVYRLDEGILRRETVVGLPSDQRTLGMRIVSDNEFYVVTTGSRDGWCGSGDASPSIAHYTNGFWSVLRLSQIGGGFNCNDLHDIWMNSAGTFGFAGGSEGLWLRYQNNQWLALPRGTSCGIMDIEFNASGVGYVAVAKADAESCPGFQGSPVMHWSGTAWSTQSVPASGYMYDVSPDGTYAVGFTNSVYSRSGTNWVKDYGAPQGSFLGVDRDSANDVWIAGNNQARCYTCTLVAVRSQGYWTSYDVNEGLNHLRGLDMYGAGVGAAVGNNALVIIQPPPRVDVYDTLSPTSGLTSTTFTGQDQGSTSNAPGSLSHQWSWGDGTTSLGPTASHQYSAPGWKEVTHTVTDSRGHTQQKVHPVFVDAQDLGTISGSSSPQVSGTLPSGGPAASQQFRVTYTGSLNVKAELVSGPSSVRLRANLASPVEGAGNWPYEGATERVLDGTVPYGGVLYVSVDRPAGSAGGSYTLRLSEVSPTALSSKLTPGATPGEVTYLDRVRFSVTWTDGAAPDAPPTLSFGSETPVAMHAPMGTLNFASGVTYTYEVTRPGGGSHRPIYRATQGGVPHVDFGAPVLVTGESVAYHDFQGDAIGRVPSGFNPVTPAGKCCNYWHVANSNDAKFPSTVQLGRNGNVAWFANQARGDYQSTSSQLPAGALETPTYDLRLATRPALSFASYYETEDLGSADNKLVRISSRNPVGGSWSGWQTLHVVDGYEGGYKQWRTQVIDLASYDGQLVKFQFIFEANAADNDFLGWMIDDVAVGTDYDDDSVPDRTERRRIDLRAFEHGGVQWITEGVDDAESFVRYVNRPEGYGQVLQGLIRHEDPSTLRVWVGAISLGEDEQVEVYDRGSTSLPCTTPSNNVVGTSRPAAQRNGFDLRITIDPSTCPQFATATDYRDWYIKVQDMANDGKKGYIESWSSISMGRTDALTADTDQDRFADGSEILAGFDPLSNDGDRDGINERFDGNDNVPDWVPYIGFGTQGTLANKNAGIYAEFKDLRVPMAYVDFIGQTASGPVLLGQSTYYGGGRYTGSLPSEGVESVTMRFQDQYGTGGILTFAIQDTGKDLKVTRIGGQIYQPSGSATLGDVTLAKAGVDLALFGHAGAMTLTSVVNQALWRTGFTAAESAGLGMAARVLAPASLALLVVAISEPAGGANSVQTSSELISVGTTAVEVGGGAFGTMILTQEAWNTIQQHPAQYRPTMDQVKQAMRSSDYARGLEGAWRFFTNVGGTLITVTVVGNQVVDAYKIVFPSVVDWTAPTLEQFMQLEAQLATTLAYAADVSEALNLRNFADLAACLLLPSLAFEVKTTDNGLNAQTVTSFPVPACVHLAGLASLSVIDDATDFAPRQGFMDTTLGLGFYGFTKEAAEDGDIGENVHWYWDDNDPDVANCNAAYTGWNAPPTVRRCNEFNAAGTLDTLEWPGFKFQPDELPTFAVRPEYDNTDVVLPDFLAVVEQEWTKQPSGTGHRDAFAAKGYILNANSMLDGGETLKEFLMKEAVDCVANDIELHNPDAYANALYYIQPGGTYANVDVRTMPYAGPTPFDCNP